MGLAGRSRGLVLVGCAIACLLWAIIAHAQGSSDRKADAISPTPTQTQPTARATELVTESKELINVNWNRPKCGEAQSHDEADLCEQRRMAKAAEDAVYWSRIQAVVAVIGTVFLVLNLLYMHRTTEIGLAANDLNRQAFIANQRAWLTTRLSMEEDFTFARDGGGGGLVSVKITNVGQTPALEAHTNIRTILESADVRKELRALCDESKRVTEWGRPVLPGESYDRRWFAGIDATEIAGVVRRGQKDVMPIVIGCVTYQILPEKSLHQTAFAYWLSRRGSGGIALNKDVASADIELTVHTGGFAN